MGHGLWVVGCGAPAPGVTGGGTWTYGYDGDDLLESVLTPSGRTVKWTRRDDGALATQTVRSGATTLAKTTLGRAALSGRWTGLTNERKDGTGLVTASAFGSFAYDEKERLTGFSRTIGTATAVSLGFSYDERGRLTEEKRDTATTGAWEYGASGNVLSFAGHELPGYKPLPTNWSRAYNDDDQWIGYYDDSAVPVLHDHYNNIETNGVLFEYDRFGNPTTYKGDTLTFDADNRLTKYASFDPGNPTVPTPVFTAGYRWDRLRAWKGDGDGANEVYFLYDGASVVSEVTGSGTAVAAQTWGALGLVERVERNAPLGRGTVIYQYDPLGNVCQRLYGTGAVRSTDEYDAYGNRTTTTETGAEADALDPVGYKGQLGYYTDVETGLILCMHRYYDPGAGRWLTEDPIGYAGGPNLYEYCGGDPVGGVDPEGLYVDSVIRRAPVVATVKSLPSPGQSGTLEEWTFRGWADDNYNVAYGPCLTEVGGMGRRASPLPDKGGYRFTFPNGQETVLRRLLKDAEIRRLGAVRVTLHDMAIQSLDLAFSELPNTTCAPVNPVVSALGTQTVGPARGRAIIFVGHIPRWPRLYSIGTRDFCCGFLAEAFRKAGYTTDIMYETTRAAILTQAPKYDAIAIYGHADPAQRGMFYVTEVDEWGANEVFADWADVMKKREQRPFHAVIGRACFVGAADSIFRTDLKHNFIEAPSGPWTGLGTVYPATAGGLLGIDVVAIQTSKLAARIRTANPIAGGS